MKNININFENKTIEMSNTFAKAASEYGSEEYRQLKEARNDFPAYEIKIVKVSSKKMNSFKGLTKEYMRKYIKSHNDEENMKEFNLLCGETGDDISAKATYGELKMWFLNAYPEIEESRTNIDNIMKKVKEERSKKNKAERKVA